MKLGEIADALGCKLNGDGAFEVSRVSPLDEAGPTDLALISDLKNSEKTDSYAAGAFILPTGAISDRPALIVDNPLWALGKILGMLDPEQSPSPGVDNAAVIGDKVSLGSGCSIGPHVSVGDGAKIGARTAIRAGARIGAGSVIGDESVIFENVTLYERTEIGAHVRIHANTVIGADGFGYTRLESGEHFKIPQRGIVRIEDDVEIGANSSVDRATLGVTLIKKGVKIDNHVQIGHNCVVGENCIIAGCSGLAGSVTIEKDVMIGGMVAVTDNVTIASGVLIAGKTGVHTSIKEPGVYGGPMAMKNTEYKRFLLSGKRIDKLTKKIKELQNLVNKIKTDR